MMGFCFDDFITHQAPSSLQAGACLILIFLMSPLFTMMITDQLLNHYMLSQILDKWSYVRIENMGRYRTVF